MKLRSARVFGPREKSRERRLHVRMDKSLHVAVKRLAAKRGLSINSIVTEILANEIWAQEAKNPAKQKDKSNADQKRLDV